MCESQATLGVSGGRAPAESIQDKMTLTATIVFNVVKPAVVLMLLFILQSCSNKPAGVSYPVKSQEL